LYSGQSETCIIEAKSETFTSKIKREKALAEILCSRNVKMIVMMLMQYIVAMVYARDKRFYQKCKAKFHGE
jgi:hypothetical protein